MPVKDYQLDLSETVPYIGGTAVQNVGLQGRRASKVAILDTGRRLHAQGARRRPAREAALQGRLRHRHRTTRQHDARPALPDGPGHGRLRLRRRGAGRRLTAETPDPDPIDSPDSGTDLGDRLRHRRRPRHARRRHHRRHQGRGPKANLYAVKVCSSISTSCSGVALIEAMDWAMDPNGDGNLADHVDIINMSLGSDYGTVDDDDLSLAVERASLLRRHPDRRVGRQRRQQARTSPARRRRRPSALSVAQTQVPQREALPLVITAPAGDRRLLRNTETVDWAPLGAGFDGRRRVRRRQWLPGRLDLLRAPHSLTGQGRPHRPRHLLRSASRSTGRPRPARSASSSASSPPATRSASRYGGGDTFVPTLVIQQSLSDGDQGAARHPGDRDRQRPSAASRVSARRRHGRHVVAAVRRSTTASSPRSAPPAPRSPRSAAAAPRTQAFGGTSGAAPMVTGAAALLKSAFPTRSGLEIKAVLMNTAEIDIYTDHGPAAGRHGPDHPHRRRRAARQPRAASPDRGLGRRRPERRRSRSASSTAEGQVLTRTLTIKQLLQARPSPSRSRRCSATPTTSPTAPCKITAPEQHHAQAEASDEGHRRQARRSTPTKLRALDDERRRGRHRPGPARPARVRRLPQLRPHGHLVPTTPTRSTWPWQVLPRKAGDVRAVGGATGRPAARRPARWPGRRPRRPQQHRRQRGRRGRLLPRGASPKQPPAKRRARTPR